MIMLLNGFAYDRINTMRIINDIKDMNDGFTDNEGSSNEKKKI